MNIISANEITCVFLNTELAKGILYPAKYSNTKNQNIKYFVSVISMNNPYPATNIKLSITPLTKVRDIDFSEGKNRSNSEYQCKTTPNFDDVNSGIPSTASHTNNKPGSDGFIYRFQYPRCKLRFFT